MTDQELNEAVARKLGIIPKVIDCGAPFCEHSIRLIPDYCHDIEAAWEVVEHISKEWIFEMMNRERWIVTIDNEETDADTAPMAICLAFLKLL